MLAKVYSAAVVGLDARPVEVEVGLSAGLYSFTVVGLPDAAVKESKERVSLAVRNSCLRQPQHSRRKVIVNLAPADLKKEGPAYDLPIAVAFLIASRQLQRENMDKTLLVGELALDGVLRGVNGALTIALMAKKKQFSSLIVPRENAAEAALVKGLKVIAADSLKDVVAHLAGNVDMPSVPLTDIKQLSKECDYSMDMANIRGQEQAKRALEIAAAGGHNILMHGPPGSGKTLLARAFPSILPSLSREEVLEVTKILSVAGQLPGKTLAVERPFRSPHHTSSAVALVGGGAHPRPGEITLAHKGVLFLDELPEFSRNFLECLRQPLEDRKVTVSRASGSLTFPAEFILIGAMNPCPCGKLGDAKKPCTCAPAQITNYQKRISGPLLDRIDIHMEVPRVSHAKLTGSQSAEPSCVIRQRVRKAREVQCKRFAGCRKTTANSAMDAKQIKRHCQIDNQGQLLLKAAVDRMGLSARAYFRLLKLSRTIADLAGSRDIRQEYIAEAIRYRAKNEMFL